VKTSLEHVIVRKSHPQVNYFTRLLPNSAENTLKFNIGRQVVTIRNEYTFNPNIDEKETLDDTKFDQVYKQYNRYSRDFGFGDQSDSVCRYAQGAMLSVRFDHTSVAHVRLKSELTEAIFPEDDGHISDLTFSLLDKRGQILKQYGKPIMVVLKFSSQADTITDPFDKDFFRLPAGIDTEDDHFYTTIYTLDLNQHVENSRRSLMVKTIRKIQIEGYTFDRVLTPEATETCISNMRHDISRAAETYQAAEHPTDFEIYWLGKMLLPGQGVSSYILHARGTGAELIHKKMFVVAKNRRGMVMCMGTPELGKESIVKLFNTPFRSMEIDQYDQLDLVYATDLAGLWFYFLIMS